LEAASLVSGKEIASILKEKATILIEKATMGKIKRVDEYLRSISKKSATTRKALVVD
jgi:hypothetical protein